MYFLSTDERQYLIKSLLPAAREQVVADELRGWSWHDSPVAPPYPSVALGVYEVAGKYCSTGRDIWLRKVQKLQREPNTLMVEGRLLHSVMARIIYAAKRAIWTRGVDQLAEICQSLADFDEEWLRNEWTRLRIKPDWESLVRKAKAIWSYEAAIIASRIREASSRQPFANEDSIVSAALPVIIEQKLNGFLLGLSKHLSMDAYQSAEPLILELKFGERQDFHKLQVTGYALAAESLYEYPLNLGCIVYPSFIKGDKLKVEKEYFLISEELRQEFLDLRDERMRMVFEEIDPGLMDECPHSCPFFGDCHGVVKLTEYK